MTPPWIGTLLAALMVVGSLLSLRAAAIAHGERKEWRGPGLMGVGFLVMGVAALTTARGSDLRGVFFMGAAAAIIAGSMRTRQARRTELE